MDGSIGDGLGELIKFLLIVSAVSVPLGIWKAVDIAIWLAHHIHFS